MVTKITNTTTNFTVANIVIFLATASAEEKRVDLNLILLKVCLNKLTSGYNKREFGFGIKLTYFFFICIQCGKLRVLSKTSPRKHDTVCNL